jgi:hypothetical protein
VSDPFLEIFMTIEMVEPATQDDPRADAPATEVVDRAEIKEGKVVVEFSLTQAGLAALREKYSGPVPDVKTREGMELAKAGRREMVSLRTALESRRKELKAPALDFGKKIDAAAAALTAEIKKLELPWDSAIVAEEDRKENERLAKQRAEEQRVREHEAALEGIKQTAPRYLGSPSADIRRVIEQLQAPEFLDARVWQEYEPAAKEATRVALEQLAQHLVNAEAREQLAALQAQQKAAEALRAAEQKRVDGIKDSIRAIELAPGTCVGLPSRAIRQRLDEMERDQAAGSATFAEFADDAMGALATTVVLLRQMLADAEKAESDAAERAVEQQELRRLQQAEAQRQRDEQAAQARREREAEAERQRQAEAKNVADRRTREAAPRMLSLLQRMSVQWGNGEPIASTDALADEAQLLVQDLMAEGVPA